MNVTTKKLLDLMHFIAWIILIGLSIQIAGVLVAFTISFTNPLAAEHFYMGTSFRELMRYDLWQYVLAVSFVVVLLGMKASVAYLVVNTLSKVRLERPFSVEVVRKMEIVSCLLFSMWLLSVMYTFHSTAYKLMPLLAKQMVSGEFLIFAALLYVFSQIFKRGTELQNESDLTV